MRARIRRLTRVVAMRASRINLNARALPSLIGHFPQHAMRRRAAADVARADHEHAAGAGGRSRRGVGEKIVLHGAWGESSAGGPRSESGRLRLSGRRILLRWRWQAPPLGWPRPPDSFKKRSESKGAKHWFAQSLLRPHAMNKRAKLAQCFQRRQRQLALASLVPGPRTGSRRGGLKSCALKEERLNCNQVLETGCRQAVSHC